MTAARAHPRRLLFLLALLWAGSASAAPEPGQASMLLDRHLLSDGERDSRALEQRLEFSAPSDRALVGARVRLTLASPAPIPAALEVLVNQHQIALLPPDGLSRDNPEVELAVDPEVLAERNLLTLRLVEPGYRRCELDAGSWRFLHAVTLILSTVPLPLPDDLALLPLPFVDRERAREASVPLVLAGPASFGREEVRLAGIAASWFGVEAGLPLRFPVYLNELPDSSAVVLALGDSPLLPQPAPPGPSARMMDHPLHPGSNVKLLVLSGRDLAELEDAVQSFTSGQVLLAGSAVALPKVRQAPEAPYASPRWLASGRTVPLGRYPGAPSLAHRGSEDGTIAIPFRVAPDLWTWPTQSVLLELGYQEQLAGALPPAVDVEFNGQYVATLPPLASDAQVGRARLRLPSEALRGFNELRVHVRYPTICSGDRIEKTRVALAPDSILHLESFGHFAALPDLSGFVYDGFPFTRVADLGETVVVLPARPRSAEISAVLSALAHFGSITGRAASRVTVAEAERVTDREVADKDLLVVGLADDNALLQRWANRLPLAWEQGEARVQVPVQDNRWLSALGVRRNRAELKQARALVERLGAFAAVEQMESPVSATRSVVALTAGEAAQLPQTPDLLGFIESRQRQGDLLLHWQGRRWMFQIGPAYHEGELDPWTRARWFFASHWILLPPALLLGTLLLALRIRRGLARRMRSRLATGEAS